MPASEYKNTISGGLKLKGAKDAGVKKSSKKKKAKQAKPTEVTPAVKEPEAAGEDGETALQQALANEDELEGLEARSDGKTEAQRRHEEMRRKRVSSLNPAERVELGDMMLTEYSWTSG